MKVVFRVDASIEMGTGHLMRSLTFAEGLREQGVECYFICREHPGTLLDLIRQHGFTLSVLPACEHKAQATEVKGAQLPAHAAWLGCGWATDARQTGEILSKLKPEWLVVDHYALDREWESNVSIHVGHLMVIDDLADRLHTCDLLLDQNLGRKESDYTDLVPEHCKILVGPQYALLRPEFSELRKYSLQRRKNAKIQQVLISMGGIDQHNATGQILMGLNSCQLPADCKIIVVMGKNARWIDTVRQQVKILPWYTEVLVDINNLAQRMADSDLAIGAAGSTSWERCCLGLPTLLVVLAENQKEAAQHMVEDGVAQTVNLGAELTATVQSAIDELVLHPEWLEYMTEQGKKVTEGDGCQMIVKAIKNTEFMQD